jgi:Tfp pilus assembly protein PilF
MPRTTETIWPMLLLISGSLTAFCAWATTANLLLVGAWLVGLRALLVVGLVTIAVGGAALVVRRARSLRGTYMLGGRVNGYAWPGIILLLLSAFVLALWPMPYPWQWLATVGTVLCIVGALGMGLLVARAGANPLLHDAQKALAAGDKDKAKRLLQQIEHETPDDYGVQYVWAIVHRMDRRYDLALARGDRLIALRPELYYGHAERGMALAARGQERESLRALERAAQSAPHLAQAHFNLGVARAEARDYEAALVSLARAMRLGLPDDVTRMMARYYLLHAFLHLGQERRALQEWRRLRRQRGTLRAWRSNDSDAWLPNMRRHKPSSLAVEIERAMAAPPHATGAQARHTSARHS